MWVAPCSWRTRMSWILESTSASNIGIAAPPERPNMYSTPSRSRHWISFSPPVGVLCSTADLHPAESSEKTAGFCLLASAGRQFRGRYNVLHEKIGWDARIMREKPENDLRRSPYTPR